MKRSSAPAAAVAAEYQSKNTGGEAVNLCSHLADSNAWQSPNSSPQWFKGGIPAWKCTTNIGVHLWWTGSLGYLKSDQTYYALHAANQFKRIKTDRKSDKNYRIGLHSSVRPSKLNCVIVLRRTVAHPNAYPQTVNAIDGKNGYCTSCPVIITCSSSYALCKSLYSFTSHKRCNILSCACLFTKTTNVVFTYM